MSDRCRDCGNPVIWVVTLKGKRQPLNAASDVMRGDMFIAATDHVSGTRLAIPISRLTDEARNEAQAQGIRLYRSHIATCSAKRAQRTRQAA